MRCLAPREEGFSWATVLEAELNSGLAQSKEKPISRMGTEPGGPQESLQGAPQMVKKVYKTVLEPYRGWKEALIRAFRDLRPEASDIGHRYKQGRVARIVKSDNAESYLVGAKFDLNGNQGAKVDGYNRVVEALIRRSQPIFERCPSTRIPLSTSSPYQTKADCGIKIVLSLRPISQALGI